MPKSAPSAQPLKSVDSATALRLAAAASDLALIIDAKGIIRDLIISSQQMPIDSAGQAWLGQAWIDVATSESRPKIEEMLADAAAGTAGRWRHVNYPSSQGADIPVYCSAVPVGSSGDLVAFGRDLRNMASLQQRLVEAHQAMERDYLRMRHMETRYRLLFELASEAVLIVDANTERVLEANPAASKILGQPAKKMLSKPLEDLLPNGSHNMLNDMLMGVRASGHPDARTVILAKNQEVSISASLFRQETGTMFLVRLSPMVLADSGVEISPKRSLMLDVLEHAPDGFVITILMGRSSRPIVPSSICSNTRRRSRFKEEIWATGWGEQMSISMYSSQTLSNEAPYDYSEHCCAVRMPPNSTSKSPACR